MENQIFCQSCGMPMTEEAHFGSETNGSKSEDYCCYCYKAGAFTSDCTMEEMIDFNLNCEGAQEIFKDKEESRKMMLQWFPTLKRWKKA